MRPFYSAQVGALPVQGKPGGYRVLLITSRESGRWVIPKGWQMKGIKDHDAAALEAHQEAGVRGRVHSHPMGAYTYEKRKLARVLPVRVMVYMLEVASEKDHWREENQRRREWMEPLEAATLVQEYELKQIFSRLNEWPDARQRKTRPVEIDVQFSTVTSNYHV